MSGTIANQTYSFLDVQATLVGPGGAISLGSGAGTAEEGITIERLDDKDSMVIGSDGTPMHSLHASKAGTVSIRVLKTSPVNFQLATMYALQTVSSALHGQNVLTISDTNRGDVTTCQSVAFRRFTGITYAKDANMNEWAFNAGIIDTLLGVGRPSI